MIVNNGGSDYNGGGKGKLSDESFEQIVESVKEYLEDERQRPVVEKAVKQAQERVEASKVDPSQVSRGSSLERSKDGLLTLAGENHRLSLDGGRSSQTDQ